MTAWYVSGKWQYTDDGFNGSIMTYFVNDFLLLPLPPPTGTARGDLQTSSMQWQGSTTDCGMYQFFMEQSGLPVPPKEVLCVSRDTFDLVLRQTLGFSVQYREFAPFEGRSIPRSIVASEGTVVRCRVQVQQVDQQTLDEAALTPPTETSLAQPGPNWISTSNGEGVVTRRITPMYPAKVQPSRAAGYVRLLVLISRNGDVMDAEPLLSPAPELTQAGIEAVKQWAYAPVIRHGEPVERIAEVNLKFAPKQ
jgi:Gram-negative bacterial TonB protein C-terminal